MAYLTLFLPDKFPDHVTERSLEYWFGLLFAALESMTRHSGKREGGAETLEKIKAACRSAFADYQLGEIDRGRFLLQDADALLGNLARAIRSGKGSQVVNTPSSHQQGITSSSTRRPVKPAAR